MKKHLLTTSLLFGIVLLTSCDNYNELLPIEKTKENTWYWGYFKGEVNGEKLALENESNQGPIRSAWHGYYLSNDWEVIPDSVNLMQTLIHFNDSSVLRIALCDLTLGERYLTLPINLNWYESSIDLIISSDPEYKRVKARYIPNEENPFRVEIDDVLWLSRREPIVDVKVDGVLYNKENSKDAIVIKGNYGTR